MNYYCAPMEGLTGYIYRNAHNTYFHNVDKYFSPFIAANRSDSFKTKELNDIQPEHNQGILLVPQLLTNNAEDFIHTAKKIELMGYHEINLNLGCPSGTVVSRNRGSGFLSKREDLDIFLDKIYSELTIEISIKTRIGKDQPEEFYELIEIFNKYSVKELIIHPRIQKDFYKNKPNMKIFGEALISSKNPVCYNGDLVTVEDYAKFRTDFPDVNTIMFGRGLIANPGLIGDIKNTNKFDIKLLKDFHDMIYEEYKRIYFGDRPVLCKMKELWFYMIAAFSNNAKYAKKIKKSERLCDYEAVISSLFNEQQVS